LNKKIKMLFLCFKVRRWWPHNLLWVLKHGGACGDVLLLPDVCHGARGAEVPLVEKVRIFRYTDIQTVEVLDSVN
jgi:hypothetical protein